MAGYPGRTTRTSYGPVYENQARIRNQKQQFDAGIFNLLLWQHAGINGLAPRAYALCTVSGGVNTIVRRWLAWDPDSLLAANQLVITRTGAGVFTWEFGASSYPDKDGNGVPLAIEAVDPRPQGTANLSMIGAAAVDGFTGTMHCFTADSGAAADPDKYFVWFI